MNNVQGKCHSTLKCVKDVISQPIPSISTWYIQYIFPHTVVAHYVFINTTTLFENDSCLIVVPSLCNSYEEIMGLVLQWEYQREPELV